MRKNTRNFLLRNIPVEIFALLEKSAKEHHRSKTQEALVALTNGLTVSEPVIQKPKPFKWGRKITGKMVTEAIEEGRE